MPDPEKTGSTGGDVQLETGPYIVRSLIKDVALSASGDDTDVRITCVEVWQENLYIGTSAGEILHHVQIPADPNDASSTAQWILASRLQPPVNQQTGAGIQQMLLLPSVNKACILSSNTLNFYLLPELSPAFPQMKPLTCGWVGGVDLNQGMDKQGERGSMAIMMCLRNKIRIVEIGDTPVKKRDIEFGGCLATTRRGNIACVADARSYALVDVVQQQKIPLLPISSLDEQSPAEAGTGTLQEDVWPSAAGHSRSSSAIGNQDNLAVQDRGHGRSTSLGVFRTESPLGDSPRNSMSSRHGFDVPAMFGRQTSPRPSTEERRGSLPPTANIGKPLPAPPEDRAVATPPPGPRFTPLHPVIVSPTESEFLVVTGTAPSEPGLGMFVNLEGDIVRGTMEFSSFPESMIVDGKGIDLSASVSQMQDGQAIEEGYVLSVVRREVEGAMTKDVEIQRWDLEPGQGGLRQWLNIKQSLGLGIRKAVEEVEFELAEVIDCLAQQAFSFAPPKLSSLEITQATSKRLNEERTYFKQMAKTRSSTVLWTAAEVSWTLRNPLVLRLDAQLRQAEHSSSNVRSSIAPARASIERLINDVRGQRSQTELEFYTLAYIRQKAALLLFIDLILKTTIGVVATEHDKRFTEEALLESELDPRFIIHFIPGINEEVLAAPEGIWIQGGIKDLMETFISQHDESKLSTDMHGILNEHLLHVVKQYLLKWRRKRGNPSVVDGDHVFPTVDAALLRLLLLLDKDSPTGPATPASIRADLNSVVDSGVECFERAVQLLEEHKRLYILSRLYQSRKNAGKVLATWKRIISGEPDLGGEFIDGEIELKTYLTKLRNRALVEEYGTWLANRNPKLGVQVFADDHSRTTWTPADALAMLRSKAPAAVKEYLEYLVFAKKQAQHINELINYYLDNVVNELAETPESRSILISTYETYRALQPPKPTYRQFIEDNAVPAEWWHSRLRLLQLLGEMHEGYDVDVDAIRERLEPYEQELVPEMIILNGRQGHHEKAIQLSTHGLGDFDMAISYCLRGGYSTSAASSTTVTDRAAQRKLFLTLLQAFLSLPDDEERVERTAELLERFGPWFDVETVLGLMPQTWSVETFGAFLVGALGRLVRERNETRITRALWGAESLRTNVERIAIVEKEKPVIERGDLGGQDEGIVVQV